MLTASDRDDSQDDWRELMGFDKGIVDELTSVCLFRVKGVGMATRSSCVHTMHVCSGS